MSAEEIADASGLPLWVVKEKLGIDQKHIPNPAMPPNAMAVEAAKECIAKAGIDPKEIDVLLCTPRRSGG
jgi:3-oxoacyl-[acyl-carrier-protein] synthase-3